jgi:hypothetical protein
VHVELLRQQLFRAGVGEEIHLGHFLEAAGDLVDERPSDIVFGDLVVGEHLIVVAAKPVPHLGIEVPVGLQPLALGKGAHRQFDVHAVIAV